MAQLVSDPAAMAGASDTEPNVFDRLYRLMIKSRTLKGRDEVANYINNIDDETLARLGYDRDELLARRRQNLPEDV